MIFVTVGTQNFNFKRLLKAVEKAVENNVIQEEVIAQIGENSFQSEYIKCIPFMDKDVLNDYIANAHFVISHAGTGSIIASLKKGKKVIVAARLSKYNEHIDNHQLEILRVFAKMNLIVPLNETLENLEENIKNIHQFKLSAFESNTIHFNNILTNMIKDF